MKNLHIGLSVIFMILLITASFLIFHKSYGLSPFSKTVTHKNVVSTVFWVGEQGSEDNQYIDNNSSAWDENWVSNYPGKENPYYFALPYSDIDDNGNRKSTAKFCKKYNKTKSKHYSWCKNNWVAITSNNKTVYAQWEDVGPYQEDDINYVFGRSQPLNSIDPSAGIDVSPAVQDNLGLQDVDKVSWRFITSNKVPKGPWDTIVTTPMGDKL